MNRLLTIDTGNTATKLSIFQDEEMVCSLILDGNETAEAERFISDSNINSAIRCCVGAEPNALLGLLKDMGIGVMTLTPRLPLPIEVEYDSIATLGGDRIAAAVGAVPVGDSALVVDSGTALTLDVVACGRFLGGNISPGISLRFKSLNDFTARLPLVSPDGRIPFFGTDTQTAIRAGVIRGVVAEIADAFEAARNIENDVKIVLTGGDAALLAPLLAVRGLPVEMRPDAVGLGLVRIYNFNNR